MTPAVDHQLSPKLSSFAVFNSGRLYLGRWAGTGARAILMHSQFCSEY
jgi:hypothetical protein